MSRSTAVTELNALIDMTPPARHCEHCQRPIPDDARADARFCSTGCRVNAHRWEKQRIQREADRYAREQYLAREMVEYKRRAAAVILKTSGRISHTKADEIVEALLAAKILPGPFVQRSIYDNDVRYQSVRDLMAQAKP